MQLDTRRKVTKFGSEGVLGAVDIMHCSTQKRIDPRKQVKWKVIIQLKDKTQLQSTTVNISRSGLMFRSPMSFDIGERAYIKIFARHGSNSKVIDAVVEIKHTIFSQSEYLAGALILKCSEGTKEFIDAFVGNRPLKVPAVMSGFDIQLED